MHQVNFLAERPCSDVVSVVIPVYKEVLGLKETIDSILGATLPEGKSLQLVVVNDGADPEITELCERYKLTEVAIKPNRGSYYARNRGLEQVKGDCIGFADADVTVDRDWLVNAVNYLSEYDYLAGHIRVSENGASRLAVNYQQLIDFNVEWHMSSLNYGPTANVWIKRSVIEGVGGFHESLYSGGDLEFGDRISRSSVYKMKYCEDVLVVHPPRTIAQLFKKSKRLAYGHMYLNDSSYLASKFSFAEVLKRSHINASQRRIPFTVNLLRLALFAHRSYVKVVARFVGGCKSRQEATLAPIVKVMDHSNGIS